MIPARYYQTLFLFLVTVVTLFVGRRYSTYHYSRVFSGEKEPNVYPLLLMIVMVIFIGTRPINWIFVDMLNCANEWDIIWNEGVFRFSLDRENFLFDNLRAFMATAGMPVELFFLLNSIIYFGGIYIACRKFFPNDTLFTFVMYLAAFSTFSYGTNGIKAGSAASLFLIALAYRDNLKVSIPFAIASWGFHHSMIMVLCSYLVVLWVKKPKYYFIFWFFSFLVAALHISTFQVLFSRFADERGQEYLENIIGSGFRLDFILYSSMPVLVGYIAVFKKGIRSLMYDSILCLYLMTNSIWMLCMYASFTNRIAYLSWFLYPIALIYPFLKEKWGENQFNSAKLVSYGHLSFTLFMSIVYYGLMGWGH